MDQALYDVFQQLRENHKLPECYSTFFIPILDPFHWQWTMEKSIMSGFQMILKDVSLATIT